MLEVQITTENLAHFPGTWVSVLKIFIYTRFYFIIIDGDENKIIHMMTFSADLR